MTRTIYTTLYKSFIADLVESRKKARLTQQEVARRLGRPQSYIAKIEGIERRLDIMEYIDITNVIGIDPAKAIQQLVAMVPNETKPNDRKGKRNR